MKNTEQIPPARNSGLPEFTPKIPRKYPQNTPKYQKCPFWIFFRYFRGIFLGFQNFGLVFVLRGILLWKFRVGPSRGSVPGRGVLTPICQSDLLVEWKFRGFFISERQIFSRVLPPDFFSSFLWERVPRTKIL